jgi:ureidoacrylate peracid hydrolase
MSRKQETMSIHVTALLNRKYGENKTIIDARPEPVEIDVQTTAMVLVDMQNAFCSEGGMMASLGVNIAPTRQIIARCSELLTAVRKAGSKVIYLQTGFDSDLHACGGPDSPYWYKGLALTLMRNRPDVLDGKPLIFGTHDADIIDELTPVQDDIVIRKQRYSGFYGTALEQTLFTYRIRHVIFAGVATNVCVESTLRDAFFRDFFPILVSDAACHMGPDFCQLATLYNVERYFGWVTSTDKIKQALGKQM